jgi:hypothetical protein
MMLRAVAVVVATMALGATSAVAELPGFELTPDHKIAVHAFAIAFQKDDKVMLTGLETFEAAPRAADACREGDVVPDLAKAYQLSARTEYTLVHEDEVLEKPLYAFSSDLVANVLKADYVDALDAVGRDLDTELADTKNAEQLASLISGDCVGSLDKFPPIASDLKRDAQTTSEAVVKLSHNWTEPHAADRWR